MYLSFSNCFLCVHIKVWHSRVMVWSYRWDTCIYRMPLDCCQNKNRTFCMITNNVIDWTEKQIIQMNSFKYIFSTMQGYLTVHQMDVLDLRWYIITFDNIFSVCVQCVERWRLDIGCVPLGLIVKWLYCSPSRIYLTNHKCKKT